MKSLPTISIFVSFFLVSIFLHHSAVPVTAQETDDEHEFDYLEGSGKGPKDWGKIKKEWEACNNGGMQSPIDLSSDRVTVIPHLMDFTMAYHHANATLRNRGHDISVHWEEDAGWAKINGTKYQLQQCHWHSPSEHSVNGRRYDLELHMVHMNPNNKTAVLGLFYKFGRPDHFLSTLTRDIRAMVDKEHETVMGVVDPKDIRLGGRKFYRYLGSLTVPPCTEGVIWTINKKIRTVSREQVKLLREAVHDYAEINARPVQPLNRREIKLYHHNPFQILP